MVLICFTSCSKPLEVTFCSHSSADYLFIGAKSFVIRTLPRIVGVQWELQYFRVQSWPATLVLLQRMLGDGWVNYPPTMPPIWSFIAQQNPCKLNIIDQFVSCLQIKCGVSLIAALSLMKRQKRILSASILGCWSTGAVPAYKQCSYCSTVSVLRKLFFFFLSPPCCPPTSFPFSEQSG